MYWWVNVLMSSLQSCEKKNRKSNKEVRLVWDNHTSLSQQLSEERISLCANAVDIFSSINIINSLMLHYHTDYSYLYKYGNVCHIHQWFPSLSQWIRPIVPRTVERTLGHKCIAPVRAALALDWYTTLPSRGCVGLKMSIIGCPVQNRHCWTIASSWSGERREINKLKMEQLRGRLWERG